MRSRLALAVVLVPIVACTGTDRIERLEARVEAIEERLYKADHEPRVEPTIEQDPIIEIDGKPAKWWCTVGAGGCFRSHPDCDAAEAANVARAQYSEFKRERKECLPKRIAFCARRCFALLSECTVMEASDALCVGVE